MKPGFWTYENAEKQAVWFRGYVKKYHGASVEEIPCPEVQKNRQKALADAKAMIKKMKGVENSKK